MTGGNDWRSPAHVINKKSDVFTRRSSYDILFKRYKVKHTVYIDTFFTIRFITCI